MSEQDSVGDLRGCYRLWLITHFCISIIFPMILSLIQYSFEIFGCNYVCIYVCTSPHLPRFQVWPSKSRLFRSQSIDSERKQKNVQNTNKVWCGKLKTESTRKLSNFYFQWGKTLYQNNLTNIAFFFTFFKGLRCNNKSSVVTPKKIFHGRQRKWMSNFRRYVITQVKFWKFHV